MNSAHLRTRKLQEARLYGILDLGYVEVADAEEVTEALLDGGVDVLQLRAKGYGVSLVRELAERLAPYCRAREVPFIVNDFVEIACDTGADGVHLGQEDGSIAEAAARLPAGALVGRSTHSPLQARTALAEGASYIGFGPLFPTPTKEGRPGIGLCDIAEVENVVGEKIPVFCIGGVKRDNLTGVLSAGARRVVIVSGLLQAEDIAARCQVIRAEITESELGT